MVQTHFPVDHFMGEGGIDSLRYGLACKVGCLDSVPHIQTHETELAGFLRFQVGLQLFGAQVQLEEVVLLWVD